MPSYVVTGVSKGIGWGFLTNLSSNPNNTVIGLVRDKVTTDKRVKEELAGRDNIFIMKADLTDYAAMKKAADETAKITGGSVDYLIGNAANVSKWDNFDTLGDLAKDPEEFDKHFHSAMDVNVLGNVHFINFFMPLVLQSPIKKVAIISSGMGDAEMASQYEIWLSSIYSTSKAAVNMITAKYQAQYKKDGVLFLSICPGMVDVGHYAPGEMTPRQLQGLEYLVSRFKEYEPNFAGPDKPEDSVKSVLSVIENSTVEKNAGNYLSHFGTKKWI